MGELDQDYIQELEHQPKLDIIHAQGIPLIDLSPYNFPQHDSNGMARLVAEISDACKNWGFFQVINHGVPTRVREKIGLASRKFFASPQDEKRKVTRNEVNLFGYSDHEITKNVRGWKEVFDCTIENPTIIEVEYPALLIKRIVLFKCSWYDPTPRIGTKVHSNYKLVEVNANRRFNKFEAFIFAVQAGQVFYAKYPTIRRAPSEWIEVCRMKARSTIEMPTSLTPEDHDAFQNEEAGGHSLDSQVQTTSQLLVDVNVTYEELDDEEMSTDDEIDVVIESDHDNLEIIDDYDTDCDDD